MKILENGILIYAALIILFGPIILGLKVLVWLLSLLFRGVGYLINRSKSQSNKQSAGRG